MELARVGAAPVAKAHEMLDLAGRISASLARVSAWNGHQGDHSRGVRQTAGSGVGAKIPL
ncbi:MAG: hypothetical protein R2789_10175 [Microthrixaceae bacterium]